MVNKLSLVLLLPLAGVAASGCQRSGVPAEAPPTITTKSGIEMVVIPAGAFEMGSRAGREDERPLQRCGLTRSAWTRPR